MRIGVVADTHELGAGWGSPPELLEALTLFCTAATWDRRPIRTSRTASSPLG